MEDKKLLECIKREFHCGTALAKLIIHTLTQSGEIGPYQNLARRGEDKP